MTLHLLQQLDEARVRKPLELRATNNVSYGNEKRPVGRADGIFFTYGG